MDSLLQPRIPWFYWCHYHPFFYAYQPSGEIRRPQYECKEKKSEHQQKEIQNHARQRCEIANFKNPWRTIGTRWPIHISRICNQYRQQCIERHQGYRLNKARCAFSRLKNIGNNTTSRPKSASSTATLDLCYCVERNAGELLRLTWTNSVHVPFII